MSGVQDYRLYAGSELRRLERALEPKLLAWAAAWAGAAGELALVARAVGWHERESLAARYRLPDPYGTTPVLETPVGRWLAWQCFGCDAEVLPPADRLVEAPLCAALQALCCGLASAAENLAADAAPDQPGAVLLTIDRAGHALDVLLPAACVARHLPAGGQTGDTLPPLCLSQARLTQPVLLEITARSASFSVAELMTACAGDILRLDHRVDDPFDIRLAGGVVLGQGRLGRQQDRLAIKFLPFRQEAR